MNSYEIYSKLNPYIGLNREKDLVKHRTKDSRINYYLVESWITGEPDKWYTSNAGQLRITLEKYGLSCQEWYDIAVLGFSSPDERPKCKVCNSDVEFSLCFGYRTYCSKKCQTKGTMTGNKCIKMHKSWKDKLSDLEIRNEFSRKQSLGQTGMKRSKDSITKSINTRRLNGNNKLSPESRRKISIANKKNYSGNDEAIDRIISNGYHKTKCGYYKPAKCDNQLKYLSSWELDFMRICDVRADITRIDKGLKFRYYNTLLAEEKTYVSDFLVTLSSGIKLVIEIKPKCFLYGQVVTDKRNAAIRECLTLGYKYIMLTNNDLYNNGELNLDLDLMNEYNNQYKNGYWKYNKY